MKKPISVASRKAKGRRLQQRLRDLLLEIDPDGMYESRPMGNTGSDIIDPASRCPWEYVECRNTERAASLSAIRGEMTKARGADWAYIHAQNRVEPVAVISWSLFKKFLQLYYEEV